MQFNCIVLFVSATLFSALPALAAPQGFGYGSNPVSYGNEGPFGQTYGGQYGQQYGSPIGQSGGLLGGLGGMFGGGSPLGGLMGGGSPGGIGSLLGGVSVFPQ